MPEHGERSATRCQRMTRGTLAAASRCAALGAVSYVLGSPLAAVAGLVAAAVAGLVAAAVVAVTLSAMLDRRDSRSPFIRLIVIIGLITGRQPEKYLPPYAPTAGSPSAGTLLPEVTATGPITPSETTQSDRTSQQHTEYAPDEYATPPVPQPRAKGSSAANTSGKDM
jgi:hypothetical protein